MRLMRAAEYRRMRWKNGLGETTEIAVHPEGATVDSFDWRISMARVDSDGPFSAFDGIDRTLSVLNGAGLRLVVDGATARVLTVGTEPYRFPGDRATHATLVDGSISDLNVMTRRTRFDHLVRRIPVPGHAELASRAGTTLVLCSAGSVSLRKGADEVLLETLDSASWAGNPATFRLACKSASEIFLIELFGR